MSGHNTAISLKALEKSIDWDWDVVTPKTRVHPRIHRCVGEATMSTKFDRRNKKLNCRRRRLICYKLRWALSVVDLHVSKLATTVELCWHRSSANAPMYARMDEFSALRGLGDIDWLKNAYHTCVWRPSLAWWNYSPKFVWPLIDWWSFQSF